jgi:hypothetical protein
VRERTAELEATTREILATLAAEDPDRDVETVVEDLLTLAPAGSDSQDSD